MNPGFSQNFPTLSQCVGNAKRLVFSSLGHSFPVFPLFLEEREIQWQRPQAACGVRLAYNLPYGSAPSR
jgi:hypothetical protein